MSRPDERPVVVDGVGSAVWTLTLNRPERRNAVNEELQQSLLDAVQHASVDPEVRTVVLTGAGTCFSGGGDLSLVERMGADADVRRRVFDRSRSLYQAMRDLPVPAIAAVNGPAVGAGCSVALLCDIVVLAENAHLSDPRVRFGLAPGDGAAVLWPLLAGLPAGRAYLLTGERLSAPEAFRIGLVHRVVAPGQALTEAISIAGGISALPPFATRATKRILNRYLAAAEGGVFDLALDAEERSFDAAEHRAAIRALHAWLGDGSKP